MKIRIAAYIRVSTQKQKIEGVSLEMQKSLIIKHLMMLEIISSPDEITFYVDAGYSAKSLERPGMKKLIEDIKARKIDILYCYDLSRISRDFFDANVFFKLIAKYEITFKVLCENIENHTAGGRFNRNIKLSYNQYERERVVERTNDGLISIAESGRYPIGGKMFFGYVRGIDKNIYVNEKYEIYIKTAFKMASMGDTEYKIIKYLNDNQKEYVFNHEKLYKMFSDQRYMGKLKYKGKDYDDIVPAIIDQETFKKAKLYCKKKRISKFNDYIFSETLVCNCCGKLLSCTHGTSQSGTKYFYYKCKTCKINVSQNKVDSLVSNIISIRNKKHKLKDVTSELQSLNIRYKRLYDMYLNESIEPLQYSTLVLPIKERVEELTLIQLGLKKVRSKIDYYNINNNFDKKIIIRNYISLIQIDLKSKKIVNIDYK